MNAIFLVQFSMTYKFDSGGNDAYEERKASRAYGKNKTGSFCGLYDLHSFKTAYNFR